MTRHTGDHTLAKHRTDARTKAWAAMYVLRSFTIPQLIMTTGISEDNARTYLLRLQRAGIVRKAKAVANGRPGNFDVWILVRHTGPDAPIAMKDGRVYDPNTRVIHGEPR